MLHTHAQTQTLICGLRRRQRLVKHRSAPALCTQVATRSSSRFSRSGARDGARPRDDTSAFGAGGSRATGRRLASEELGKSLRLQVEVLGCRATADILSFTRSRG